MTIRERFKFALSTYVPYKCAINYKKIPPPPQKKTLDTKLIIFLRFPVSQINPIFLSILNNFSYL